MTRGYKVSLLTALYFAQGLPFGFFTQTLPVLLRDAGLSLKAISALSLLAVPWALKFLWAPFVDHRGTRRAWLLPLQLAGVVGALVLAGIDLEKGLAIVLVAAFAFNLVAACQDIATDGLAVRILEPQERGLGNAIQVGAYRLGMIFGGGLLLWVFAKTGWNVMFLCMAALLAVTVLPVLALQEPPREPSLVRITGRELLAGWITRLATPGFAFFALLVCCYKFGDTMVATLIGPFMRDHGLSKETIAVLKGAIGSVTSLLGAALGGWFAFTIGRRAALLTCGLLQTASLVFYVVAALNGGGTGLIWAGNIAEHLFGGMATVAVFTLMMDASDPQHASTDYTLLASAIVITAALANFVAAAVADAAGYGATFMTGMIVSAIGCVLLVRAVDSGHGPARLRIVWRRAAA